MKNLVALFCCFLITQVCYAQNLAVQLESILNEDQQYRNQIDGVVKQHGWESNEMEALWKTIHAVDSVNLIKVKAILDENGWPEIDVIGEQGSLTLFLVIQHADRATQEKYLPMLRAAVKTGDASAGNLALLEDRVALAQGKYQVYGSQVGRDTNTKQYYICPLTDPDNVDKRRAEVGLDSMSDYIANWQIKWDVEQYKKDLPQIVKKEKLKTHQ